MVGELYIVATPIGNLSDISARAIETLNKVDLIVCEDTRVTRKLLNHLAINKPTVSLHHHSSALAVENLVKHLLAGKCLAYVSDAGTPGVSDPGGVLVEQVVKQGVRVIPIPGASAVMSLLQVAGVNLQSYTFLGFPPHKKGRQKFWQSLKNYDHPVVFFESTYRIKKALLEIKELYPEKKLVMGRELTKNFETIYRGTAQEVAEGLEKTSTKGEFVILIY